MSEKEHQLAMAESIGAQTKNPPTLCLGGRRHAVDQEANDNIETAE
jgi:hypothetical protein